MSTPSDSPPQKPSKPSSSGQQLSSEPFEGFSDGNLTATNNPNRTTFDELYAVNHSFISAGSGAESIKSDSNSKSPSSSTGAGGAGAKNVAAAVTASAAPSVQQQQQQQQHPANNDDDDDAGNGVAKNVDKSEQDKNNTSISSPSPPQQQQQQQQQPTLSSSSMPFASAASFASSPGSPTSRPRKHRSGGKQQDKPDSSSSSSSSPFISFDGLYDCHKIDFSKLSQTQFDFEGVEAVGLRDLVNASIDKFELERNRQKTGSGGSGATTSVDMSGVSSSQQQKQQESNNNPNADELLGDLMRSSSDDFGLHHSDTIAMFESSPLAKNLSGNANKNKHKQKGGDDGSDCWDESARIAELTRQLHRTIDKMERDSKRRFWLFKHVRFEGVLLYVFHHESDLRDFLRQKAPELLRAWGSPFSSSSQMYGGGGDDSNMQQDPMSPLKSTAAKRKKTRQHNSSQSAKQQTSQPDSTQPVTSSNEPSAEQFLRHEGSELMDKKGDDHVAASAPATAPATATAPLEKSNTLVPPQQSGSSSTTHDDDASAAAPAAAAADKSESDAAFAANNTTNSSSAETTKRQASSNINASMTSNPVVDANNQVYEQVPNNYERRLSAAAQQEEKEADEDATKQQNQQSQQQQRIVDEAEHSSHSSSTVATTENLSDTTWWLDIQTDDFVMLKNILKLFPSIRHETFESFKNQSDRHSMRHFSHHGYLAAVFAGPTHKQYREVNDFVMLENDACGGGGMEEEMEARELDKNPSAEQRQYIRDNHLLQLPRRGKMCCILSKHLAITFHVEPLKGLASVVKRLHMQFRHLSDAQVEEQILAEQEEQLQQQDAAENNNHSRRRHHHTDISSTSVNPVMTPGWVMSMLYQQCVQYTVPDVANLTSVIEAMDAQILLQSAEGALSDGSSKASGQLASRNPLIVRVARFRRGIAEHRANLSRKEHLTSLLVSPKMSVCSYVNCIGTQQRLHDLTPVVQRALQQLDSLREILTQCNSNLMAQISIAQATSSNKMAAQMTQLSIIATITMPFSLLLGAFGVNTPIPWQTTPNFTSLVPFAVIVSGMVVWCGGVWLILRFMNKI